MKKENVEIIGAAVVMIAVMLTVGWLCYSWGFAAGIEEQERLEPVPAEIGIMAVDADDNWLWTDIRWLGQGNWVVFEAVPNATQYRIHYSDRDH